MQVFYYGKTIFDAAGLSDASVVAVVPSVVNIMMTAVAVRHHSDTRLLGWTAHPWTRECGKFNLVNVVREESLFFFFFFCFGWSACSFYSFFLCQSSCFWHTFLSCSFFVSLGCTYRQSRPSHTHAERLGDHVSVVHNDYNGLLFSGGSFLNALPLIFSDCSLLFASCCFEGNLFREYSLPVLCFVYFSIAFLAGVWLCCSCANEEELSLCLKDWQSVLLSFSAFW